MTVHLQGSGGSKHGTAGPPHRQSGGELVRMQQVGKQCAASPDQQTATRGLRRMRMFIARCGPSPKGCIGIILARRGPTAAPERPNRTLLGKGATAARLTRLTSGRRRSLRGLYNKILSLLEGSNKPYRWRQAAYTLRLLRVRTKGEGRTFASAPSVASAGVGLLCARLIAARPIAAGSSDETDAADAIFGPRAHPNHPASGATLTRERDFDAESAEKRLRPS